MDISRRNALKLAAIGIFSAAVDSKASVLKPPIVGVKADSGPYRSESGVGALIPWADKLWAVTYVSSRGGKRGSGTGLYVIDENLDIRQVHVSNGVYANRMLHAPTDQVIIGPYIIDMEGNFRVIEDLLGQGGMGQVFRVRNRHNPEIVRALKVIHRHITSDPAIGPEFRARFLREAGVLDRLQHPNICRAESPFEEEGELCLIM